MRREELDEKKQMVFEFVTSKGYRPLTIKEMATLLRVPSTELKDLRQILDELTTEGKLTVNREGKIKVTPPDVKVGRYMATQRGFGFVRVLEENEDIFVPGLCSKNAMDGDLVQVIIKKAATEKKRSQGEILNILEHGNQRIVGEYQRQKGYGIVIADNQKITQHIYVHKEDSKGAVTGHKVVVDIISFGDDTHRTQGKVVEILGHVNDPGVDILSVIRAYDLPEEYPNEVMRQAEGIGEEVPESEKEGRADYRMLPTVTIDGEDAKDLDDAITLTRDENIYHLGVHIADVSQYVTENSPLDKEALKRGTSVYLVDRVIPMLPHRLSNGICSLNQGEDRLALSCMMDIDQKGNILDHRIEETVIRVDRRMSYTSIYKIVRERDKRERGRYKELVPMFEQMYELSRILRKKRKKQGSIDFDFPESKITLDEEGKPIDVREYERNSAHELIEEFMLAANQTVAEEYFWRELPFVYRTHERPDIEKIFVLNTFVNSFGYALKIKNGEEIHPKEMQKLMKNIAGRPEEALISRLALRSMKQARYTTECEGHFGLAMKYYCHFTSPIRRYPDLQIHRIIKENIHGKLTQRRISHYNQILPDVTAKASSLERRADDAERQVEKIKKAEYMEQFVGETFDGIISGLTHWGMFVELPNTVEGMIRIVNIPTDYFYYDADSHRLIGQYTRKVFKLGEPIRVTVAGVDKLLHTVDFVLAQEQPSRKGSAKRISGESRGKEKKKNGKRKPKTHRQQQKGVS